METKVYKDFLDNEIRIGDRAVRVHSSGHLKYFKKVTVAKIDPTRNYGDNIGVITDGNEKIGWTYPSRLITQRSFITKI
jgi:hypothetical protein